MSDALNDLPPRTHNEPPLSELLPEETVALSSRAEQLADSAGRAVVTDDDTASKATLLAGMMKETLSDIDKARDARKRPFLEAGRMVDAHYHGIEARLAIYDQKRKLIGGPLFHVVGLVDAYRIKKEAQLAAERRRLEEEARRQREAAEAAARAQREAEERERLAKEEADRRVREAEEAARNATSLLAREKARREAAEATAVRQREEAAARDRQIAAEIEQRQRMDAANRLDREANQTVATPIRTGYGVSASRRTVWKVEIDDLTAAIRHCRKVDEATILAAVQQIYDRQVRAGVRSLPGARVVEDSITRIG